MKASTLLLSAALSVAGVASSFAQVLTFDTITPWEAGGRATASFEPGTAVVQTFQLPALYAKLNSITWRFVVGDGNSVDSTSTFAAYFSEWNDFTAKPIGSALWQQTGIGISDYGIGSEDITLSPNYVTNPSKTYAMILVGTSVAPNVLVANLDDDDAFPYGINYYGSGASGFASLSGLTYSQPGLDWGFSTIELGLTPLTPVPEAGTVAVAFAGVLVVGLGLRRRMLAKGQVTADQIVAV